MATVLTDNQNYVDIANELRAKGVPGTFYPEEMAWGIASIPSGTPEIPMPSDYQRCEYIETQNNCAIQLDVIPNIKTRFTLDFSVSVLQDSAIIGGRETTMTNRVMLFFGQWCVLQIGNQEIRLPDFVDVAADHRYSVEVGGNVFRVDESEATFAEPVFTIHYRPALYLFRFYSANNATAGSTLDSRQWLGKLYEAKVWNGTVLVHHLIPCYHKINGTIGLWDSACGVFRKNALNGTFLKGADV